ncbi:MAG: dienelactone hydrolase family protein, partial [Pirellula sp.]
FGIHEQWPDAICVYMQGLPTASKSDPKGELPGWQKVSGDNADRDLKFFDVVLRRLIRRQAVDEKRIYAAGFSNGGFFTFLLWAERANVLAAVAPIGAYALPKLKNRIPKPCIHIAGEKDDVVEFERQQKTMESVRQLNGCDAEGHSWNKGMKLTALYYQSKSGTPVVCVVHPAGHEVPQQAGRLVSRFFKENPMP